MKESPEKHVGDGAHCPVTVHVFDTKRKGKDNSDMVWGRWSGTVNSSQGTGNCGNR